MGKWTVKKTMKKIEEERNDIIIREQDEVHSLGGYFT